MPDAIRISGVTKTFGPKVAVRDLDLAIPEGSLHGFIGPNGAGKTTTIRMIMSIIFTDRGEIRVLGHRSAMEARDRIGYLPEERGLYRKMRVGRFLEYMARLKGVRGAGLEGRVRQWLDRVGLGEVRRKRCEELSKGMQQKVQFVAAVIHEPDLLILDEPFSGLDPVNARLLRDLIDEQHRSGRTIIFSTHIMTQAEQLCSRIVMIHEGRKVLDNSLEVIRARHDPRTVVFEPASRELDLAPVRAIPGVAGVTHDDGVVEVSLRDGTAATEVIRAIAQTTPLLRIEARRPTLEDVFIRIVLGSGADEQALRELLRSEPAKDEPRTASPAEVTWDGGPGG
jgi:ABC-2 type transport system ATP-binding protein